jgi:hypothetical protein
MRLDAQPAHKVFGAISALGGLLVVISYFLPTYAIDISDGNSTGTSADFKLISNWDNLYHLYSSTPGGFTDPNTGATIFGQPHLIFALYAGFPLALGALLVALGVWTFLSSRPGFIRNATALAATALLALSTIPSINWQITTGDEIKGYPLEQDPSLVGLGSLVFFIGVLVATAAVFMAMSRREPAAPAMAAQPAPQPIPQPMYAPQQPMYAPQQPMYTPQQPMYTPQQPIPQQPIMYPPQTPQTPGAYYPPNTPQTPGSSYPPSAPQTPGSSYPPGTYPPGTYPPMAPPADQ